MFTDIEKIGLALIAGFIIAFAAKYYIAIKNRPPEVIEYNIENLHQKAL